MKDLAVTRGSEFMVAQVEGETGPGIDFLDAYNPEHEFTVVDSGRILLPEGSLEVMYAEARESGLTWEETQAAV